MDSALEAPRATWRETASLRRRTRIPILLDELVETDADIVALIADDVADGVGIKISRQGGLSASRRQRDLCAAAGLVVSVQDTVGSEIAFAALLHLAQSTRRNILRCALDTRAMISRSVAQLEAPVRDGGVQAPEPPGLGVSAPPGVLGEPLAVYDGARA